MTFCYTGKIVETRKELEEFIVNHGHEFHKSITWDTEVLAVGKRGVQFTDKKSKKQVEAEQKGIRIIHIEKLDDMLEYFI